jgi:hypothetical protein
MRRLWVVEMAVGKEWEPTTDASFRRYEAELRLVEWRERNPDDTFRVWKYEARREP